MDKSSSPHQPRSPTMPNVSEPTYEQSATEPGTVTMRWKVNVAIDLDVSELGEAFRVAGVEADHDQIAHVAEAIMNIMARKAPQAHQMPLPSPFQAPLVQPVQSPPVPEPSAALPVETQSIFPEESTSLSHPPIPEVAEPSSCTYEVQPAPCPLPSSFSGIPPSSSESQDALSVAQPTLPNTAASETAPKPRASTTTPELEAASAT